MANTDYIDVLTVEINHDLKVLEVHNRCLSNDNRLKDMYKIINCDCVTCTEINVAGKYYDIWSDDEALLKANPIPTFYVANDLIIFGNLIFAKADCNGNTCGLNEEDMKKIYTYIQEQDIKLYKWIVSQRLNKNNKK